ncbi:LIM and calponin homology domains-containing protein 1-like isoform X7 [Stegodyphus dumicola]|uniref:LIM and calponin homology domains-containing protein 1-like isoform X7 n=1 Tax=Stegodyphus dumicola TaxID=202533 RepID=UPI0015B1966D|nr:LIM and calponin homology domains-containing protein 1-like isoform X7 [Stegodyphus dumicola]
MPGTTRYSATFDRPYEEEEPPLMPTAASSRRSRSQSWQANSGLDRAYTPLGGTRPVQHRSSSTDSGSTQGVEHIPTRTVVKTPLKAHNNPFQFVKVGTCPLYKKAEEQIKKVKEIKKPDVLKEEEEEWQSNLDSWKSRRRKMSEDVFRRQEELRQMELEEQISQAAQKKTKTFSEMVESRAHRGRTLSLCLISSPLELQNWEMENNNNKNSSNSNFSAGSEESSNVNSEDESVGLKRTAQNDDQNDTQNLSSKTNGHCHNSSVKDSCNNEYNTLSDLKTSRFSASQKEGTFIDSGLESISSSHKAGDTPDSGSDFSQDSASSMDCESPRISGLTLDDVNLLDEYNSKSLQMSTSSSLPNMKSSGIEVAVKIHLNDRNEDLGFAFLCKEDDGQIIVDALSEESIAYNAGVHLEDQILAINGESIASKQPLEIASILERAKKNGSVDLLLWRHHKAAGSSDYSQSHTSVFPVVNGSAYNNNSVRKSTFIQDVDKKTSQSISSANQNELKNSETCKKSGQCSLYHTERSIESENEMYVDDFEELNRNSKLIEKNLQKLPVNDESMKNDTSTKNVNTDVNTFANQKESSINQVKEDSLSIIYQSQPVKENKKDLAHDQKSHEKGACVFLKDDVPPVEKVAEEMEKLILEQLEEEERAKEMAAEIQLKNSVNSPENILMAPLRLAEPPKEKPPPPPSGSNEPQKPTSLKRVNSTKRIKKEIHKRRSNFLGIENADENISCEETSVPPPPALEDILKAEMELDRESMRKLESAAAERLTLEENEIIQKEQEIIQTLEKEERQQHIANENTDFWHDSQEKDRIQSLKEERKRIEEERMINEEQHLRLLEEAQLREREEYIRKQEGDNSSRDQLSASEPVAESLSNTTNSLVVSSVSPDTSLSGINGEGKISLSNSVPQLSDQKAVKIGEKTSNATAKPAVPPKPLKKKEAIRKERERLRQEQEALQREREEHRQKLIKEQEELAKNHPKSHAPDVPYSRLGPLPPLVKPAYPPQLTPSLSALPGNRENITVASRSIHGSQNGSLGSVDPFSQLMNKQNRPVIPSQTKVPLNEIWGQQKMPSVRKQNHEPLSESRYNQNHWLIQEAEMRRITELKERQRATHHSQTHLAEDNVCSITPKVPVLPPTQNQHQNYATPEILWTYGNVGSTIKKYPSINPNKPFPVYAREPTAQAPVKPSRTGPLERQEQMLSVSGRKRCSHCNEELGRGAAMIIESLQLYYHIHCFQCCVCQAQLGNGSCGTDVRVRNNKLHCHNCYSNDEAGVKCSQV